MARFWAGPLVWRTLWTPHWSRPDGAVAMLDTRSIPQCAQAVTPAGLAIFITPDATNLGSDYINLGTDPLRTLTEQQKRQWESAFKLPQTLAANRLRGVIWETLTLQADPIGDDRCLPLLPNRRRRFELWLAGQLADSKDWSRTGFEHAPMIDLLKRMYRRIRQATLDGKTPSDHHRKWLGFQVRKFRDYDYHNFIASDLPDEEPLEPTTTLLESFNQGDSTTLGPDQTWSEGRGDWSTVSNKAGLASRDAAAQMRARVTTALSGDDQYAQCEIFNVATSKYQGPNVRQADGANTFYTAIAGDGLIYLTKLVTGTQTNMTNASQTAGNGQVWKAEIDGSTLKGYVDSTEKISHTDTAIPSNLFCGISQFAVADGTIDTWEAADLAAPGGLSIPIAMHHYKQMMGVN